MGMSGSEGLSCHHKLAISEVTRSLHLLSNLRSLLLPSTLSIDRWPDLANDIFDEVLRSYKLSVSMLLRPCGCFAEYSDLGDTMSGEMEPERMELVYATAPSCQGNGTMKDVKTGEVLLERMGASYSNALLSKEPLPKIGPSTVLHGHQWRKSGKKRANNAHNQRAEERKSWTTVTPAPHFDGHQWRKYGEKHISNSEFPRNYYRCSHFKEQKCPATKTIQQKEGSDDPAKFIVAYKMRHTCKSMELVYPLFVERSDHREPVISFAAGVVAQRKLNEAEEDERGIEIISYSAVPVLIDLNLTIEA